jgi:hypothetical protein
MEHLIMPRDFMLILSLVLLSHRVQIDMLF